MKSRERCCGKAPGYERSSTIDARGSGKRVRNVCRSEKEGRVWYVKFSGSEELKKREAKLTGKNIDRFEIKDFGGWPILTVLHSERDKEQRIRNCWIAGKTDVIVTAA